MKKIKLQNSEIIILLLFLVVSILSYYFFKISSLFLIIVFLLTSLKVVKVYERIDWLKKNSFTKICIVNVVLFLWFAVFFGMFFKADFLYSGFGGSIALFLKEIFGSVGSVLFLFSPIIYFGWRMYRKYSIPAVPKPTADQLPISEIPVHPFRRYPSTLQFFLSSESLPKLQFFS